MLTHHCDNRGVVTLCLNRPELHNAFDDNLIAQLNTIIRHYAIQTDVRLLVLKATGKSFSAGADLNWMKRVATYSPEENKHDAEQLAELMSSLYHFPCPTLAIVQGAALGGGVGLVSCCDLAIASDKASFALSEVKLGLVPAVISPYVMAAIGHRQAQRYFLTGERFNTETAYRLGLVQYMCTSDALDAESEQIIQHLLLNSPQALSACKRLIQRVHPTLDADLRDYTTTLIADLRASTEGKEGLSAFLAKRPAGWIK
ncbi:enoyl-CoA hydratase-related protein [Agitococcus lubricus]|uniref:Methylglutaconyl-CoA hydratase n=1 Tax=Agitococcus lubricus TaxID=1077255 RepID=A0A2T5IWS0_9GAMM|nr:enoyl-CoA hydratase-related protein [Agitococcus lubricus]PTQ88384.1 methylglutaconyl-CoA hydratase [Agitococcus lubricus]